MKLVFCQLKVPIILPNEVDNMHTNYNAQCRTYTLYTKLLMCF